MSQSESRRHPEIDRGFSYPDPAAYGYAGNLPFPHAVIRNAWSVKRLAECKHDIARFNQWEGEKNFFGSTKKRYCANIEVLPQSVARLIQEASSPLFLAWLMVLTSERALLPDPYLAGGGIHQIGPGGFLKVHADFNWSEQLQLYRRLNLLLYLNPDWQPRWGGALELWNTDMSACVQTVLPDNNTMVIFTTDDKSYHGHPHPLECPAGVTRDSIALYYYSPIRPAVNWADKRNMTDYRPIPGDTFTRNLP